MTATTADLTNDHSDTENCEMKITLQRSCWSQRCENGPVPKKSSHFIISGCSFSSGSHLVDTFANNAIAGLFFLSIVAMKIRSIISKLYRVSIVWKLGFNRVHILFYAVQKLGEKRSWEQNALYFEHYNQNYKKISLRKHPFLLALRRWGRGEERGETGVFASYTKIHEKFWLHILLSSSGNQS